MSHFMYNLDNEDLLVDPSSNITIVSPDGVENIVDELETNVRKNSDFIGVIATPVQAVDDLRESINDGNYQGAIDATIALGEAFAVSAESWGIAKPNVIDVTKITMMDVRAHLLAQESFINSVMDKIKAFLKWCYEKIVSIGNSISNWFTKEGAEQIKSRLSNFKGKRISQVGIKGAVYTYNGNKPLTSSVQLVSSASKVAVLFKRYGDYIKDVNDLLSEFASEESKLSENSAQESVLSAFIEKINKVATDKKTDEVWLGFTMRSASDSQGGSKSFNKLIFTVKGQKAGKDGKPVEADTPVLEDYKMDVTGDDLANAYNHFESAIKASEGFSEQLNKVLERLKVVEKTIDAKAKEENSAKLYKSIKVALEVSGDTIKNIGLASGKLAEANKYWFGTLVNSIASNGEKEAKKENKPN